MLEQDLALVTGASRGIGRAIALALGGAGATVVGTATTAEGAEQISAELRAGRHQRPRRGLERDRGGLDRGADRRDWTRPEGLPTILVNNAGIARDALILRMKSEDWEQTLRSICRAVFRLSKACLRRMLKERHGRIVNIGSVVGSIGNAGPGALFGRQGRAGRDSPRHWRSEVATRNITVNIGGAGLHRDRHDTRA